MQRRHRKPLTRRQFLTCSSAAFGAVGLLLARASESAPAAANSKKGEVNPFAYDVSRLSKTDPKLLRYEQVGRILSPREEARRIAVGPDDRVYVAAGSYVAVLTREGAPSAEIALSTTARCLAVSPEGDLLVGLRDHVDVFDEKGQRRASWPIPGARSWITGLSVFGTEVYLADAGQRVVVRCDRSGKVLGRIGEKNKERTIPGFIVPSPFFDLEMHRDGLLRVANPGRHRVETYTVDGDLEFAWGEASAKVEGFCGCCNPINLALLKDGRVITCEKGLPRVKIFRADGGFECVVAGPEHFPENARVGAGESFSDQVCGGLDVAVDSVERIYVLDSVAGDIRIMARKADSQSGPASSKRSPS